MLWEYISRISWGCKGNLVHTNMDSITGILANFALSLVGQFLALKAAFGVYFGLMQILH